MQLIDVGKREDRRRAFGALGLHRSRREDGDVGAERCRHLTRLFRRERIEGLAALAVGLGKLADLRERRTGHQHRLLDRAASVAFDLDERRRLETAACREGSNRDEPHPHG